MLGLDRRHFTFDETSLIQGNRLWRRRAIRQLKEIVDNGPVPHMIEHEVHGKLRCIGVKSVIRGLE